MYPFFILILSLVPWSLEYQPALYDMRVVVHEHPYCDGSYLSGAWTGPDRVIRLCPAPGDPWAWLALHESQHIMASTYLPDTNFDLFSKVAIKSLEYGDYTDDQVRTAKYILTYGSHELHAELPWITGGKLHPSLQRWYPWLDLTSRIATPQELAPRTIFE